MGRGDCEGFAVQRGRSVVELALARLVNEATLVLGTARTALPGAILPLQHFSTQCVALSPLSGSLQPPHLASLLQQHSSSGHRSSCVVQGPGFPEDRCQLSIAEVLIRQGSFRVRGRWPRLQHYGAAGDINGHARMLNEEVLQGIALEAGRPKAGPLCSKTGGRGNKPALIHQGGRGWRAACRSRRGPGVGRSCIAVYRVWEWEAHAEEREQQGGTHTHIRDTGDGERKGIISQTCSSIHRAQREPEGQDP